LPVELAAVVVMGTEGGGEARLGHLLRIGVFAWRFNP
jgi:hypothetical protein